MDRGIIIKACIYFEYRLLLLKKYFYFQKRYEYLSALCKYILNIYETKKYFFAISQIFFAAPFVSTFIWWYKEKMGGMLMKEHFPFINTPLPYAYDALEPFIDAKTMELHHDRHLQTYINNLNIALNDQPQLQMLSLEELLAVAPSLPAPLSIAVERNAGGVYNHRFFFNCLSPCYDDPQGELFTAINNTFDNRESFIQMFTQAAMSVFGSGYVWLAVEHGGGLVIVTTANQETPLNGRIYPILTVDIWEHAYYLKHYNNRSAYLADWTSVINWVQVEKNYRACMGAEICDRGNCWYIYRG